MLIKVTDQCTMMRPHCMDAATKHGSMMTFDTFREAVAFGLYLDKRHFVLSGGEPTENKNLIDFCRWFDNANVGDLGFSIVSNGMWLKDESKCKDIEEITNMQSFVAMQVFTHKKWYKEYDYVVSHKGEYEKYNHVIVAIDDKIWMQDLGRARYDNDAQNEVDNNPYFMSCLNASLMSHQSKDPVDFGVYMTLKKNSSANHPLTVLVTSGCRKVGSVLLLAMFAMICFLIFGRGCGVSSLVDIVGSIINLWHQTDQIL